MVSELQYTTSCCALKSSSRRIRFAGENKDGEEARNSKENEKFRRRGKTFYFVKFLVKK